MGNAVEHDEIDSWVGLDNIHFASTKQDIVYHLIFHTQNTDDQLSTLTSPMLKKEKKKTPRGTRTSSTLHACNVEAAFFRIQFSSEKQV